jgi:hypothetical protein
MSLKDDILSKCSEIILLTVAFMLDKGERALHPKLPSFMIEIRLGYFKTTTSTIIFNYVYIQVWCNKLSKTNE